MIKIVRKNKKIKCFGCGAVLKFGADDVKVEYYETIPKEIKASYIECPICKRLYYFR